MIFTGKQVSAKIFVEELAASFGVSDRVNPYTYSTGRLQEITNFKAIEFSNSSSLDKTFRITLANPGHVMATSIRVPRGLSKPQTTDDDRKQNKQYLEDLYDSHTITPFGLSDNESDRIRAVALDGEFIYGYRSDGVHDVGVKNDYMLGEMQRIWCILRIETEQGVRYHRLGGIITGFYEGVDYAGQTTFTIACAGFCRLLELARVHTKQYFGAFYETQSELFAKAVLSQIFSSRDASQQDGIMASYGPFGVMLYAIWVTNATFSWYGRKGLYAQAKIFDAIQNQTDFVNTMFYQAPIWLLSAQVPQAPEDVASRLKHLEPKEVMPQSFATWINATKAMFTDRKGNGTYLSPRNQVYQDRKYEQRVNKELFENDTNLEFFNVAKLLPRVYYDELIQHLYSDDSGLQIFEKRLVSSLQMYTLSTSMASDILTKMAATILGVMREDDAGNLMFEIPRYWEAPALNADPFYNGGAEEPNHITISAYAKDKKSLPDTCVTVDPDSAEYILHGNNLKGYNGSVAEANVVTHVEIPSKYQFMEPGSEVITGMTTTGYSGNTKNEERKRTIEMLERRYGFRSMTAQSLYSEGLTVKNPNGEAVRLKVALDNYADCLLDFRNYARMAITATVSYSPWIDCCRNALLMDRGELWMIIGKQVTYRIGETEGDATTTLSLSNGHYVSERLGYPYLDALNTKNDSQYIAMVEAELAAQQEEPVMPTAPGTVLPDSEKYDDIIQEAASHFDMSPDIIKSLIAHESGFKTNAAGKDEDGVPSGAEGLMQITKPAWADVKQQGVASKGPAGMNDVALSVAKSDPYWSIMFGTGYLALCYERLVHDINLTLVGYNRGYPKAQAALAQYNLAKGLPSLTKPTSDTESLKVCAMVPAGDGNPRGDIYVAYVRRQFNLYGSPSRDLYAQGMPSTNSSWLPGCNGRGAGDTA